MDISTVIIFLGLLIFFSHVFSALFSKTKIPNVLLLMLIGLAIGPVFKLVLPDDIGAAGRVFTTITLICILFDSGIGLDVSILRRSLASASVLTLLNFVCMVAICFVLGRYVLGMDLMHSLYLGAALGGTSSAIVIPMLSQLKPGPKANMVLLLESTLSDVLCLAVGLSLLSGIESGQMSVGSTLKEMLLSIVLAVVVGFVVGWVWLIVQKHFLTGMKNPMFTSFALAFIMYGICEKTGVNGGLAILTFGITFGNLGKSRALREHLTNGGQLQVGEHERSFYGEIVFVLQTYFFVYIGICIEFRNVWHLIVGALIVLLAFLSRRLTSNVVGKEGVSTRDRRLIASLGAKGLIAAVLATMPLQSAQNLADAADRLAYGSAIRNVAYAVVLFSIILCSVLVIIGEIKKDGEPAPDGQTGPDGNGPQAVAEPVAEPEPAAEAETPEPLNVTEELRLKKE